MHANFTASNMEITLNTYGRHQMLDRFFGSFRSLYTLCGAYVVAGLFTSTSLWFY